MSSFDRIVASTPVNRQAALQMADGDPADFRRALQDHFEECPPMKRIEASKLKDPGFVDYTGRSYGRLVVLGKAKRDSAGPGAWVCRCKCGHYCTRKSKSLKVAERGGNSFVPMCGRCWYLQKLRDGYQFQKPIKVAK